MDLRLAPLTDAGHGTWYDPSALRDLAPVHLLLVDGPPGSTAPLARHPAVPILAEAGLLAPNCLILLDDALRPDEVQTALRWQAEHPLVLVPAPHTERGLAVLRWSP